MADLKRDSIIEEARSRFEYAKEKWSPIYKDSRADLRFSDPTKPEQWPEAVRREREMSEGGPRPCLTFDQTGQYVRQVINTARRNKPAIKYLPVDDESDPRLAEVLQGLARQTEYTSRADVAYITALDQATRGGIGYFRMILRVVPNANVEGQQEAVIVRVPDFESVWPDPDFVEPDGSDMAWGFVEDMIPVKRFEKLYPKAKKSDFDSDGWFSKDHVRVCEYYKVNEKDGKKTVNHYKLTGEEVLEESVFPAEYVPIFPVLGNETWAEGKRQLGGCIRTAKDAQITYNFERNAEYEAVALGPKAPWLAPAEAIEGYEGHWKQANRGNLAFLPYNSVDDSGNPIQKPERINPAGVATGWTQLSERSRQDIQAAMGMFSASTGDNPNNQSGRAVLALQDKAEVGSFHYIDNLALTIGQCGRVLTQVWPVILDQEQVIRIIGEDDETDFIRVDPSLPVGYHEVMAGDKKITVINPAVGRYDVRVTVGPAFQTRQTEAAAEIGELVNGNPQMLSLLGDVWVKMRNFPEADKIAKRLRALLPPQVQQAEEAEDGQAQIPPQIMGVMQQAQQEIQQLHQQLQEAQSGMAAKQVDAQSKLQVAQMQSQVAALQAQMQQETERARIESAERIAAMNNETKHEVEELKGMIQLLVAKMEPPPALAADVNADFEPEEARPDPVALLAEAISGMNKPKKKRMSITAPSGMVYQGEIADHEDAPMAPGA